MTAYWQGGSGGSNQGREKCLEDAEQSGGLALQFTSNLYYHIYVLLIHAQSFFFFEYLSLASTDLIMTHLFSLMLHPFPPFPPFLWLSPCLTSLSLLSCLSCRELHKGIHLKENLYLLLMSPLTLYFLSFQAKRSIWEELEVKVRHRRAQADSSSLSRYETDKTWNNPLNLE